MIKFCKSKFLTYIKYYIFILFCSIIFPLILNYFFLQKSGEFYDIETIYNLQNSETNNFSIYGSCIFDDIKELKLYSYIKKKPKIISLGSSRVLQFRESFFSQPFYNLGFTVPSIRDGIFMANELLKFHIPEIIILGLDFWWFNENYIKLEYEFDIQKHQNKIIPKHLLKPLILFEKREISFKEYINIFTQKYNHHIGVRGKTKKAGFASDGSYYYTDIITTPDLKLKDANFNNTKQKIDDGISRFQYGYKASNKHFEKFLELVNIFQKKGVKVILFLPPISPEINKHMKKYNFEYITELKSKLKNAGLNIYDFTDPDKVLLTSNCEFLDGSHGGDVLYAKILSYMTSHEKFLKNYVNIKNLNFFIAKYSGFAMIPNSSITTKSEVDFLRLNCKKTF